MKSLTVLALTVSLVLSAASAKGAITPAFTVNPPVTSNTYVGDITLQISGLTNHETVVIQEFLDANTNGVIDAPDWLVHQFRLTDGQVTAIAGVTNFNVPGDWNPTTGAITAPLKFPLDFVMRRIVGRYRYKLSSPYAGRFTPITNSFTITNWPYSQSFTGKVVSGAVGVPNAIVLLISVVNGEKQGPIAGTVANNSGDYSLKAPPGTYALVAFRTNYVTDFGAAPFLTLSNNATFRTNLPLLAATRTISGKIADAANNNVGLAGLLVHASSTNNLFGVGFSDTNGNFTLGATPSQWQAEPNSQELPFYGYVGLDKAFLPTQNTTVANASGVMIALPKATALIYGSVTDDQGHPLPGAAFGDANNGTNTTEGVSGQDGKYVLGVTAGAWSGGIDATYSGYSNYLFSSGFNGLVISDGQAVPFDFVGTLAANFITGAVRDDGNHPLTNIGVSAYATFNGTNYGWQHTSTGAAGDYLFRVGPGAWTVGIDCFGDTGLSSHGHLCISEQSVIISNANATLNFTSPAAPFTISGHITDAVTGLGIANVGVPVWPVGAGVNQYGRTDPNGFYSLAIVAGSWRVNVNCGGCEDCLPLGYQCPEGQLVVISNRSVVMDFVARPCGSVTIVTTSLPPGEVGLFYDLFLEAESCYSGLNWTMSGGALPGGVGLNTDGHLSGSPGASGTFNFTARVTDGNHQTTNRPLSLVIYPPVQVTTTSLPGGTIGLPYSQQLQAAGGLAPYGWSLTPGAAGLPPNLSLSPAGLISGPAAMNGTFLFSVRVTDQLGAAADQALSLTLNTTNQPPLNIGLGGGQAIVFWPASVGTNYALEMTTNLASGIWVPASNGLPVMAVTFSNIGPAVFFRLR